MTPASHRRPTTLHKDPAPAAAAAAIARRADNRAMTTTPRPALSMLDLVAVREGGTVAQALQIALRTAQHAESLGFARYWLAEHHNMAGIASSASVRLTNSGFSRVEMWPAAGISLKGQFSASAIR